MLIRDCGLYYIFHAKQFSAMGKEASRGIIGRVKCKAANDQFVNECEFMITQL